MNTIFLHIFRQQWKWKKIIENFPASVLFSGNAASFFPSSGKLLFKEILISPQRKLNLELIMVSISRRKAVNKIILFPIDIISDSTSQNEGFFKKVRLHYPGKLLSPAGISKKTRKNWLRIVAERLLYIKWLHLNLNNGFN